MLDAYIRQYGRRLYGLCMHLCADAEDAADLYQETWLQVLKKLDRYDPARAFEPWLVRLCVNLYRSGLRRRPVRAVFPTTDEQDSVLETIPAPEDKSYTDLYAAIDRLPDKLRITVILFYFRDMDIMSTALALNVPAGTVKSRLNKARKQLRVMLEDENDVRF